MAEILGGEFHKRLLDRNGWLNKNYPGYFKVSDKEIRFFEKTLAEYQSRAEKPTYAEVVGDHLSCFVGFNPDFMDASYDWISDRLCWFIYWMKWAKANCQNPVVHFS